MIRSVFAAAALAAAATLTHAGVVPVYGTFGALAGATFNTGPTGLPVNSGIPNNPTAITTANGVTVGLTAFGRYQNPPLTNNGAGVFFATPGTNDGLGIPAQSIGTTWAFGYYINDPGVQLGSLNIDLYYDLDPSANTPLSAMGRIDIDGALLAAGAGSLSLFQDAQNLNSAFFSTGNAVTFPPAFGPFNPNAAGEYALALVVSNKQTGALLAESAILVNVAPEPASLALVGLALVGATVASRRRRT